MTKISFQEKIGSGFLRFQKNPIFAVRLAEKWRVRLSARTSPFHGGKRGSIPLRATFKTTIAL